MHDSRAKSVATQTGMLGMLMIAVTVLTLSFNVCGALSVSVITGMMAGASRQWRWQSIPVSLVSPFVILALGKVTQVDLDLRQRISVAAVCLGAFWVTYFVTFLLMRMEKQSAHSRGEAASSPSRSSRTAAVSQPRDGAPAMSPIPNPAMATAGPVCPLILHHLQGTWHSESGPSSEPPQQRIFAITKDRFSLSIVNGSGGARLVAQGSVLVQGVTSAASLVLSNSSGNERGPLG